MARRLLLFFTLTLMTVTILLHTLSTWLDQQQQQTFNRETHILHDIFTERFALYIGSAISTAKLAADILSHTDFDDKGYDRIGESILRHHPEVKGVNFVDPEGKISRVYTLKANQGALGRITQNYQFLRASLEKGEDLWLSPPFKLYQASSGFAFYLPVKSDKELKGWLAFVMTVSGFFEHFNQADYLRDYHLVIRDKESGSDFFATSNLPPFQQHLSKTEIMVRGRTIICYSWFKVPPLSYKASIFFCFLIGLFISCLATYAYRLRQLHAKEKKQLRKINALMDFTSSEADKVLRHMESELRAQKLTPEKASGLFHYVSHLLGQLTLTNKLSRDSEETEISELEVTALLAEQCQLLSADLSEKKITPKIATHSFAGFTIRGHAWLFSHGVVGNVLRFLIDRAAHGADISIIRFEAERSQVISFHVSETDLSLGDSDRRELLRRGLDVAQEVIRISSGELNLIEKQGSGISVALQFRT